MAFKRLWIGGPSKLSDSELECLVPLVRRDPALIEIWKKLVAEAPSYDPDHPRMNELWGSLMAEIHRISIAAFPDASLDDCRELQMQFVAGM